MEPTFFWLHPWSCTEERPLVASLKIQNTTQSHDLFNKYFQVKWGFANRCVLPKDKASFVVYTGNNDVDRDFRFVLVVVVELAWVGSPTNKGTLSSLYYHYY